MVLNNLLGYYTTGVLGWGIVASALTFGRALLIAAFSRRASRAVHDELCEKVLVQASTTHFDRQGLYISSSLGRERTYIYTQYICIYMLYDVVYRYVHDDDMI